MNEQDRNTRKQWLIIFLVYEVVTILNMIYGVMSSPLLSNSPVLAPMGVLALGIFFNLLVAFMLYYCAYKKSGTKLLTFGLFLVPLAWALTIGAYVYNLAPIPELTLSFLVSTMIAVVASISMYVLSWKMRRVNQRLKTS